MPKTRYKKGQRTYKTRAIDDIKRAPVHERLLPFLIVAEADSTGSTSWYRLTKESTAILAEADSLFLTDDDWTASGSPMNLAFYVEDRPWLITDTSVRKAFIYPSVLPNQLIEQQLPWFKFARSKRVYHIDGKAFKTLDGFYDEISRELIPGAKWGRNLDAFADILVGGFGTPDDGFVLVWSNVNLSRKRLPLSFYKLVEIIRRREYIDLILNEF